MLKINNKFRNQNHRLKKKNEFIFNFFVFVFEFIINIDFKKFVLFQKT